MLLAAVAGERNQRAKIPWRCVGPPAMLTRMGERDATRLAAEAGTDAADAARAGAAMLLVRLAMLTLRVAAALVIVAPLALLGWVLLR
ncbi:hypothetical protein [Falsiroseomonas oryziterrae]|uniref:hypothetical protein n=1 Tax=Falsiroseomonas oryziterrae TaxID=2911368 RepID=UPI001F24B0B0|nr:hypothetical protein [Roseomonas sp. NPKOSM-4]